MIKTYIYCSYKLSPVGFQLGTITYSESFQKEYYIPTRNEITPFVATAFEQGLVKSVWGKIPSTEPARYILMVKKLNYSKQSNNEYGSDLYMNFAFEFDSFEEFKNFKNNIDIITDLASQTAEFICPNNTIPEFALKIDANKFNSFIERLLKSNESSKTNTNILNCKQDTFFSLISSSDYTKEIIKIFQLEQPNFSIIKKPNAIYQYTKKKIMLHLEKKILIRIILFLILLVIFLIIQIFLNYHPAKTENSLSL